MNTLPPRADVDQLRRIAKERLRAARQGDADAVAWLQAAGDAPRLATAQLRLAREFGFASWPQLLLEVARRRVLDLRDPAALADFVRAHPDAVAAELRSWRDHPLGGARGQAAPACRSPRSPRCSRHRPTAVSAHGQRRQRSIN